MKKLLIVIFLSCLLFQTTVHAQRAQRNFLAENKYIEGIMTFERQLDNASQAKRIELYEQLMQLYFAYAELTEKVWAASSAIGALYFTVLDDRLENQDALSIYYHGFYAFEAGYYDEAEKHFTRFLQADRRNSGLRDNAAIWLGGAQYMRGNIAQANSTWNNISLTEINRSELAYVRSRVGVEYDGEINVNITVLPSHNNNRVYRNLIQGYLNSKDFADIHELSAKMDFSQPSHIVHEGTDMERRFYDPSLIKTLSLAYYGLSFWYAEKLSQLVSARESEQLMTTFYKGVYFFKMGRYQDAIDMLSRITQTGADQSQKSAMYLAASYLSLGSDETAYRILKEIEQNGNHSIQSQLGVFYHTLHDERNYRRGEDLTRRALEYAKNRFGRRIPQLYHQSLGEIYSIRGLYSKAHEIYAEGYRSEGRSDIRVNAPEYSIGYGKVIILGKYFTDISNAIQMFTEVNTVYPIAHSLVEITRLLDVLTNIDRDGKSRVQSK